MLQAMNTGHDGSLATIHANSCRDAVSRLELMVTLANSNLSLPAIRRQIASAIDLFVQVSRLSDGTRRVTEIAEAAGIKDDDVVIRELFVFDHLGVSEDGRVEGCFRATGVKPKFLPKLQRTNRGFTEEFFEVPMEVAS
jgi:pilus assembly protein CpaF